VTSEQQGLRVRKQAERNVLVQEGMANRISLAGLICDDRVTPLGQGNSPGSNVKVEPKREPGERYTVDSYRRAIQKACDAAKVDRWHPHQLRHNAATYLKREFGLESARVILGHRTPMMTEHYAAVDRQKAMEVIQRIG